VNSAWKWRLRCYHQAWESATQSRRLVQASRKVRAPQGKVPGNTWEAQAYGKCNREQTAQGSRCESGKGERVRQERTAPPATAGGTANPTWSKTK